jgi:hypothetical protein
VVADCFVFSRCILPSATKVAAHKSGGLVKSSTVVLLALLALGVVLFLLTRRKEASGLKFGSTDEFIQFMAAEAVKNAQGKARINLDYSVDSIKQVEEILGRLHEQYVKDPSSISAKGLGSAYGAYIGEVIRRSEPGAKWERDDAVGGEKSYPIIWGPGHSYPMAWCYHRIVNGPEDNVWVKFRVLKDGTMKTLPPKAK